MLLDNVKTPADVKKLNIKELRTLADEIRTIAKNETFHAKRFFETLQEKAGSRENIDIEAGYPFHAGSLEEGLAFAANDETAEKK